MSSKPPSKSSPRKPAPKPVKKPVGDVRAAKPKPAGPQSESATKPTAAKERVKTKVEPAPQAELSSEVLEFITAVDAYKRQRGRPFPHLSEVFAIVKSLGYHKSA
ncbi:MAG TPA: hypothetical protein VM509_05850 [Planctomycetota bacterium]|nr:hypothetical protein [Planctomycetota bacterium]